MRKIFVSAAMMAVAIAAAPAFAGTIVSADFSNGYGPFMTTSGAAIAIKTGQPAYTQCCSATGSTANLNNPFVAFGDGNTANTGSLYTNFSTVLGQVYDLSFRYAALGSGSTNLSYTLTGMGTLNPLVGTLNPTADNDFDTTFKMFDTQFIGTGGNVTLRFSSSGAGTNVDAALDDVNVSAVPEPASWAMMILGVGAVGFTVRRRQKVSTRVSIAA